MKKYLIASVLVVLLVLLCGSSHAWIGKTKTQDLAENEILTIRIDDEITADTVKQVRNVIETINKKDSTIKHLQVNLWSAGGHAVAGLTVARLLQELVDSKKVTVGTYADGWCASACTFILGAGTKGYRVIDPTAFFLVHPPQRGNMFGSVCVEHVNDPKEVGEKAGNTLLDISRELYMKASGRSKEEVESWLSCGHEMVGSGKLAVEMGLADKVED